MTGNALLECRSVISIVLFILLAQLNWINKEKDEILNGCLVSQASTRRNPVSCLNSSNEKTLENGNPITGSYVESISGFFSALYWQFYATYIRNIEFGKKMITILIGAQEGLVPGPYHEHPNQDGRKVIVHLFEWQWKDIAKECEQVLGPKEFAAVQVSPVNEHSVLWEPWWNMNLKRPWYERYRPVSYKIRTRSGGEEEFRNMVQTCNRHHIRVYVDVILNHMSWHGDEQISSGDSQFDPSVPSYDGVPYTPDHFNSKQKCGSASGDIEDMQDVYQMRNCRLLGLNDLDQSKCHVRDKLIHFLNHLIEIGVAGFRIDAAKHMWPSDLKYIFGQLDNLNSNYFPMLSRPLIYQEVADVGKDPVTAKEYTSLGRVTEFRYGIYLGKAVLKMGATLAQLKTFGQEWEMLHSHNALVFVDNHDTQRGHGIGEDHEILTFWKPRSYKIAVIFMLAWPYGLPRLMSSYEWVRHFNNKDGTDENNWMGPPHNDHFEILPVTDLPDGSCGDGWVCEHRWKEVIGMVKFNTVSQETPIANWWDNGENQIAFSRGSVAFIAINNDDTHLSRELQTGLPPGMYCDIITGDVSSNGCSGRLVTVTESGYADIFISSNSDVPVLAIHEKARMNSA